jgi:riboflavin synthase
MFTGIVTHIGEVRTVEGSEERTLEISPGFALEDIALGASIAHSGICLTVVAKSRDSYRVQASGETLARTTLGYWRTGTRINLERSLKLGDELGGHLVYGHVDAIGRIRKIEPTGDSHRLIVGLPRTLAGLVAVKGSIALDGISLTVNEVGDDWFGVTIIPHTWECTTLADRQIGDEVNLEVDMLARYVARQLAFAGTRHA